MDEEKITIIGGHKFFVRGDGSSGIIPNDEIKEETLIGLEAKEMGVVDASKAYKVLKKLLEENVSYEDGLKNIKQHIKDKVRKSFEVDWGISDKRSDRLMTETIVELDLIEHMIDEILEGKEKKDGNR